MNTFTLDREELAAIAQPQIQRIVDEAVRAMFKSGDGYGQKEGPGYAIVRDAVVGQIREMLAGSGALAGLREAIEARVRDTLPAVIEEVTAAELRRRVRAVAKDEAVRGSLRLEG